MSRVKVDGKFFRLGEKKFHVKGVTYGPFALNERQEPFSSHEQTRQDFAQMQELGANLVRIYQPPPVWLLDLAAEFELKVMVDVPLHKHRCFLDLKRSAAEARGVVRETVQAGQRHPALFAYCISNEIPPDVVRWSGAQAVADRVDELVEVAKSEDPDCLYTFANFPPTEYLQPRNLDFLSFNVYLHQRHSFENYLARLQLQAEGKPLLLSECGVDTVREGEFQKCAMLSWQVEATFRAGLAGVVVFSFTDDWVKAGWQVEDWGMGLTTRERRPKESFYTVQRQFRMAPYFPLSSYPCVSVVVACFNGAKTLKACLQSLLCLNYPEYEVILVDDGSTDATPQIAAQYEAIRYLPQRHHGLSVARNTGIAAAAGDIVAFLDADCRADKDWLYYLVGDLLPTPFAGIGGPNFLPPEDSPAAAAVMVSPGGPAPVMLTNRVAEHIPGCNMAFHKWALEEIGRFDPVFRRAGDDVDVCWRLQECGHSLGFSPSGFVWHYRRSTVPAYIRQQQGYGEAEALLERKHPEYFNSWGGSLWRGRIYSASRPAVVPRRSIIYHGIFGTGLFQTLYAGEPAVSLLLCTSLEYHVLVTLPLMILAVPFDFLWPVPLACLLVSLGACAGAAVQADLPRTKRRFWSRPLVALLFFLQPIVRGAARYQGRLTRHATPPAALAKAAEERHFQMTDSSHCLYYWSERPLDRLDFVRSILERLDQQGWTSKTDTGWNDYDVEILGNRWSRLQLSTVSEELPGGKRLFRCRLTTAWSLGAVLFFWGLLAVELLAIGSLAPREPWLWMLLLSLPMVGWYLEHEKRHLERLITAFLDDVARPIQLSRVDPPTHPHSPGPPQE